MYSRLRLNTNSGRLRYNIGGETDGWNPVAKLFFGLETIEP